MRIHSIGWWGPHPQFGSAAVYVHQDLDLRAVTFSPASAGIGSAAEATLWIRGSFTGPLDSQGANYLYVRFRAAPCGGMPRFRLTIDGVLVTEQDVSPPFAGSVSEYYTWGSWTNGPHTIEIRYLNDLRTATCDRSLAVLALSFAGRV